MLHSRNSDRILLGSEENLQILANRLVRGELVSFPTETVYGLGASALDDAAIEQIYQVKGRPSDNPLIVHVHSLSAVQNIVSCENRPELWGMIGKLACFWPGPLSLVLPKKNCISQRVSAGQSSVAIRIPNHPLALSLLERAKIPVAAPSANPSGYISPTTAEHVLSAFPNENFPILDGGPCKGGLESTVLSLLDEEPCILRPGLIAQREIERVLERKVSFRSSGQAGTHTPLLSPGLLAKHYSPKTPTLLLSSLLYRQEELAGKRLALLSLGQDTAYIPFHFEKVYLLGDSEHLQQAAALFYSSLIDADRDAFDYIILDDDVESDGLGAALLDRMRRAAAA
jgi:L-threonylcarbamoyladenylate synthase